MEFESYWHPLCKVDESKTIITKCNGIYVYDKDGKEYIDGISGLWNVSLGYGQEEIEEAVCKQVRTLPYLNNCEFSSEPAELLYRKMKEITHESIDSIVFGCTGSEAIEIIIKLVRKYHSLRGNYRKVIIGVISHSYHGTYYGSMSASTYTNEFKTGYGPMLDGFIELPFPFEVDKKHVLNELEKCLYNNKDKLAGIIVEPILASAGVYELPNEYVDVITTFCNDNDTILVFDEIAAGFGRSGKMFAFQKYKVNPDLIAVSKGINNGYLPLSIVCVSKKTCQAFENAREPLFHLSTQNGNPIACAAANATIDIYRRDNCRIIRRVVKIEEFMRNKLSKLKENIWQISEIRVCGAMVAIDFRNKTGNNLQYHILCKLVNRIMKNGLIIEWSYEENFTSCIILFLPFVCTDDDLDKIVAILDKSMKSIFKLGK